MKLIVFNELSEGGIADYAHDQTSALADREIDVTMLCSPNFLKTRDPAYRVLPVLKELRAGKLKLNRHLRRAQLAKGIVDNARKLAAYAMREAPVEVLTHYSEYLAPLWAPSWQSARAAGVRFHSVLHDPVRDFQAGPKRWHELSVRAAYRPLSNVFVHTMEPVPVPDEIPVTYIPYGVHRYPAPQRPRDEVRAELGIAPDAPLITAYGYIRDNKNLDLVIEALAQLPAIELLVAGPEQAGGNRPVAYYKALADRLGVGDRCHWANTFLNAAQTADLLSASDLSVLTYSRSFVSSSAALGVTANYRLPCLVSSGSETTRRIAERYGIGIWVEPDSADAIRAGLARWLEAGIEPDWDNYLRDNDWDRNAELVAATLWPAADAS